MFYGNAKTITEEQLCVWEEGKVIFFHLMLNNITHDSEVEGKEMLMPHNGKWEDEVKYKSKCSHIFCVVWLAIGDGDKAKARSAALHN